MEEGYYMRLVDIDVLKGNENLKDLKPIDAIPVEWIRGWCHEYSESSKSTNKINKAFEELIRSWEDGKHGTDW